MESPFAGDRGTDAFTESSEPSGALLAAYAPLRLLGLGMRQALARPTLLELPSQQHTNRPL